MNIAASKFLVRSSSLINAKIRFSRVHTHTRALHAQTHNVT